MAKRTITLTDRPPVTIDEEAWPEIASARDNEHDGQVESQANRKSDWAIRVRQHKDGRSLVYATYSYTSNWQGARCYSAKHGLLLAADYATKLVEAIKEVGSTMAGCECHEGDEERWPTLVNECIADLPAEELQ